MLLSYKFKILSYIWINLYGIGVDYRVCHTSSKLETKRMLEVNC